MEKLYEFDLMLGSGHLAGWAVSDEAPVIAALQNLARPEVFAAKYGVGEGQAGAAVCNGRRESFAGNGAKAVWEKMKPNVGMDHPSRYALVEIENVHDDALEFEPIHRVLFGVKKDFVARTAEAFRIEFEIHSRRTSQQEMIHTVAAHDGTHTAIRNCRWRPAFGSR